MNKPEYRMYFFVPYNISGRQAGIQALHAAMRYGFKYNNDEEFREWLRHHETVILLNGGTSNVNTFQIGSMEEKEQYLTSKGIKYTKFNEIDLNYMTSGICFLLDERYFKKDIVWDELIEDYLNPSDRTTSTKLEAIFGLDWLKVIEVRLWLATQKLADN